MSNNDYTYRGFTNTFKGSGNKNTMLIHNTLGYNRKPLLNENTISYPLLTDNNRIQKDPSSLSDFMRDHYADALYTNASSDKFKRHIRSPLDNRITLDTLKALNKPKPPFEIMDVMFNNYYKEKNKEEVNKYDYYKKQKEDLEKLDINQISNHKIIAQIKKEAKDYEFPIPSKMKKELYPKTKVLSAQGRYEKDNPDDSSDEEEDENEYKDYNVNKINKVHPRYKEIVENPVQGEPVGVEPKCKHCKYIKPEEVIGMIKEEREKNERRIQDYMNKVNKSVEVMMNRLETLTSRVLNRENNLLKYQENKLKVRPSEVNEDMDKPPRTPIPILNPIMKPKRYERMKSHWKTIKKIANFCLFYYTLKKYCANRNKREGIFLVREKTMKSDYQIIKYFISGQMTRLFEDFDKIKHINLAFNNDTNKMELLETSQIINSLLRTFFKCLIENTLRIGVTNLPKNILYVLYTYIVDKFYYQQEFLTSFEINRLDFNMKGETVNFHFARRGMILAFLIINKVFIQEVLLSSEDVFIEEKDLNTKTNYKFFGSILHYLVRDAFRASPVFIKDRVNITNYYRNYHLDDYSRFETAMDKVMSDVDYGKLFETKNKLIPEKDIYIYFKENLLFKKQFEEDISVWAKEFAESINLMWTNRKEFVRVEDILYTTAKRMKGL